MTQPRQRRKSQATAPPSNHPGDREPTLPVRPTREALAAALRQVIDPGQTITVDSTPDESGSYQQQLVTLPGWQLLIMWWEGTISQLSQAWGPGGVHWDYGCDRWPNWAAGPDSRKLNPIEHLLAPLERAALERRLLAEPCTPPPQSPVHSPAIEAITTDDYLGLMTS